MIDYIQLLQGSTRRAQENRVQEMTEITTNLKALAKELNVPILGAVAACRARSKAATTSGPQLSDLREIRFDRAGRRRGAVRLSRGILPHQMRKPLESSREKFAEWLAEADKVHGKAEVIIGKQRHGPTGTVELQFDAAVTRFSSTRPRYAPARANVGN